MPVSSQCAPTGARRRRGPWSVPAGGRPLGQGNCDPPGPSLSRPGAGAAVRVHVLGGDRCPAPVVVPVTVPRHRHVLRCRRRTGFILLFLLRPADGKLQPVGQHPAVPGADGPVGITVGGDGQDHAHAGVPVRFNRDLPVDVAGFIQPPRLFTVPPVTVKAWSRRVT